MRAAPFNAFGSTRNIQWIRRDIDRNFVVENASRRELIQVEHRRYKGERGCGAAIKSYGKRITVSYKLDGLMRSDIHILCLGVDRDRSDGTR